MSTQVYGMEQQVYAPGFRMAENYVVKSQRGLSRENIEQISDITCAVAAGLRSEAEEGDGN